MVSLYTLSTDHVEVVGHLQVYLALNFGGVLGLFLYHLFSLYVQKYCEVSYHLMEK